MTTKTETATFGGGCFWCIEAIVQRLNGVTKVESGYANGKVSNPSYREVSGGRTGFAEVVQVTFDPTIINYEDLITIFMTSHDPTTKNQQGADRGTQYRSAVYYHNEKQKEIAQNVFDKVKKVYKDPIVTELDYLKNFYVAEEYHQNYFNSNQDAGYCRVVIEPKVQKLKAMYADKLKPETVK